MASAEYLVESAAIALLGAHSTFTGVTIRHQQEDDATVSVPNKLVVRCDPKTPMATARSAALPAKVWEAQVTVTGRTNGAETVIDAWREAIDEALSGITGSLVRFFPSSGGNVSEGGTPQREISQTFRAMFRISE